MTVPSNQYATKAYGEHPIAIWPLDDNASFVSLISESNRLLMQSNNSIANWTLTNCSATNTPAFPDDPPPFPKKYSSEIIGDVPVSNGTNIQVLSPGIFQFDNLNQDMSTFSINMYIYQNCINVNYYEIGFRYFDNGTAQNVEVVNKVNATAIKQWLNFQFTFDVPEFDVDDCYLIIRANVNMGGGSGQYNFIINGLSVGQWAEITSSKHLGAYPQSLPQDADLDQYQVTGVAADQYGVLSDNAYYIVENGRLLAKNEGVPLVFGSENVTRLYQSSLGVPSLIFPGQGFLTEKGKYRLYTLEFWLRINPNTLYDRRILGPIETSDGLYVSKGYMTMVVGKNFISHSVSEWYRPMLVQMVYGTTNISLYVNGEAVGTIAIDRDSLSLAIDNEWFGFYNYDDIDLFEIDCISVMPYPMEIPAARRRFVWGQGVDSQQNIVAPFDGENTSISFPNANYAVNSIYPDKERWDAGIYNNVVADTLSMSNPPYSLPAINLSGRDQDYWYSQNRKINNILYPEANAVIVSASASSPSAGYVTYETSSSHSFDIADMVTISGATNGPFNGKFVITNIPSTKTFTVISSDTDGLATSFLSGFAEAEHPKFISFRPGTDDNNTQWEPNNGDWTDPCYLEFSPTTIANAPMTAIYGIFENRNFPADEQPLIYIKNRLTNKVFDISISGRNLVYRFNGTTLYSASVTQSDHFVAGIHIPDIVNTFGYDLVSFFASLNSLQILVGGNGKQTFAGQIYRVGFSDVNNYGLISNHFDSSGFAIYQDHSLFQQHYATYTLLPFDRYGQFFLDISIASAWTEYYPLYMFAKNTLDSLGNTVYDFDFLQFNIGYPSNLRKVVTVSQDLGWTYQKLKDEFTYPVGKTYLELSAAYATYADLAGITGYTTTYYNDSPLNIYVTFQLLAEGADQSLDNFLYSQPISDKKIVNAPLAKTNQDLYAAYKTKFEIVDGTIIYPPRDIDISEVAMVIDFVINQDGILSNPFKVRDMEITSQSLNYGQKNSISTKFGSKIYPYTKSDIYKDYKDSNPIRIYKKDTPYLYLTSNSGIKILNTGTYAKQYCVDIPINQSKRGQNILLDPVNGAYQVGGMQFFMKYDEIQLPEEDYLFAEIEHAKGFIQLYLTKDTSGLRGKIYAIDKITKKSIEGLEYYQNGNLVSNPYILLDEWNIIGLAFTQPLEYSNFTGAITFFGGLTFNNFSYFPSSGLGRTNNVIARSWQSVLSTASASNNIWLYWYNNNNSASATASAAPPPTPPGPYNTWAYVYKLAEFSEFILTPTDIYEAYTGTNTIVVDDDTGITITNDDFTIFKDIQWSNFVGKPA